MLIAAGILCLLIWGYLLLAHGRFWRISTAAPQAAATTFSRVAVVIPARDEADVVGRAVTSLLQQTFAGPLHVFLVDDSSSDGTATVARNAAVEAGKTDWITVIEGHSLPEGWSGKLWALNQGVELAGRLQPEFLLFTDADIVHAAENLAQLVAIAENGPYELASFMVQLHCESPAEKFLIPAFVFFFFKLYPPAWVANPNRSTAGAAGGCVLIRRAALEAAGGIEAIRNQVIDDCALAARVKHNGGQIWLGATSATKSVRPYAGLSGIGGMISRTAFNQLRHSLLLLLLAMAGMSATYLLPPALAMFSHRAVPASFGAAAWLLMAVSFVPMARLYRISALWGLALPLIAAFYMGATIHSAIRYWSGRGGEWKGTTQDPLQDQR